MAPGFPGDTLTIQKIDGEGGAYMLFWPRG